MAKSIAPPRRASSWITRSLAALGLSFLALPVTGPQAAGPAFAAVAAASKAAASKAAPGAPLPPKRPSSAFLLWLKEERPAIAEDLGTNTFAEVAKEAGERWKSLPDEDKKPFLEEAAKLREAYVADLGDFVAEYGKPAKKKKDPNAPKRPMTGFFLWLQEHRQELAKRLPPGHKAPEVTKLAGAEWKKVSAGEKAKYQEAYERNKEDYLAKRKDYVPSKEYLAQVAGKSFRKKKDPNAPKRPMSGYMLWLQEHWQELAKRLPPGHKAPEVTKLAGAEWKKVSAGEKAKYQQEYEKNKEEYESKKKEYLASVAA